MNTILKGIIIGLGKIIPGVSGSVLAISLGIYEKCINIISNIKKELRNNIKFLFLLCIGISLGIIFGSKIIYLLLNNFYLPTMCLFIGLISNTIKCIFKKIEIKKKSNIFFLLIPFVLMFTISKLSPNNINVNNELFVILLGFIDAVTMIIPGISGTAIFMIMGVYDFILLLFSDIFNYLIIFFVIGLIIGIFITSKLINYFFTNYNSKTYIIILGLIISSILILVKNTFNYNYNFLEFIIGIGLMIIGYFLGNIFDNQ